MFVVISSSVCGSLLWKLLETNVVGDTCMFEVPAGLVGEDGKGLGIEEHGNEGTRYGENRKDV